LRIHDKEKQPDDDSEKILVSGYGETCGVDVRPKGTGMRFRIGDKVDVELFVQFLNQVALPQGIDD
jgi:hypothetical protein